MTELVKREVQLSPVLIDAGVRIAEHEGGVRSITFPDALHEKFNVLLPTQEIVQALPVYRPSIRAIKLRPEPNAGHFYEQRKGVLAPTKQALESLADTAGIRVARARPLTKDEVSSYPDGSIGYEATITLRRSDGTPQTITRTKIWNREVERAKVEQGAKDQADFRRKFLIECEQAPAKTESKAVLRAIRAALQIPHTFTPAEAARPFIVVGYDLSLDWEDAETRRLVIENGLAGERSLYAPPAPLAELAGDGEAPPAAPAEADTAEPREAQPPLGSEAFSGTEPDGGGARGVATAEAGAAEPGGSVEPAPDPGLYTLPESFGRRYPGTALREIDDEAYLQWLASSAVKNSEIREAAQAYLAGREGD